MKATLRRILKYTPAVVLGLLACLWLMSCISPKGFESKRGSIGLVCGTVWIDTIPPKLPMGAYSFEPGFGLGQLVYWNMTGSDALTLQFPIPLVMTAVLPLAIGPFICFRFRIWHFLAYTSLVAAELAFYTAKDIEIWLIQIERF
jgi:hypothetical protein